MIPNRATHHIFPKKVNIRVNFNKNTRLEATTLLKVNFVMSISWIFWYFLKIYKPFMVRTFQNKRRIKKEWWGLKKITWTQNLKIYKWKFPEVFSKDNSTKVWQSVMLTQFNWSVDEGTKRDFSKKLILSYFEDN